MAALLRPFFHRLQRRSLQSNTLSDATDAPQRVVTTVGSAITDIKAHRFGMFKQWSPWLKCLLVWPLGTLDSAWQTGTQSERCYDHLQLSGIMQAGFAGPASMPCLAVLKPASLTLPTMAAALLHTGLDALLMLEYHSAVLRCGFRA